MALNSLFTGSTALSSNSNVLDVVGNNLANLNTTGFKSQRVLFKDLLYQTITTGSALSGNLGGTNPQQVGFGVSTGAIDTQFQQGAANATGRNLDAAIQGDGFFIVNDGLQSLYSRSGAFSVDTDGFLVDSNTGFRVQRFGSTGEATATTPGFQVVGDQNIQVPFGATAPGIATTTVNLRGNLSAALPVGGTFNAAIQVFDNQSTARALSIVFTKTAANTFDLSATIGGGTVSFPGGNQVAFDNNGLLVGPETIDIDLNGLPGAQTITLDFGSIGDAIGVTQFGGPSTVVAQSQDGVGAGVLSDVTIDQVGILQGVFTNGRVLPLAQLAIASFSNVGGLNRTGNNYFQVSASSGDPFIGQAATGGRGVIQGGTLEGSNVDISIEFSRLIIAQRGFQVNTRTITVANEVLQELANIIR